MKSNINRQKLAHAIHLNAVNKGFWDVTYPLEQYKMLIISELGEAIEAERTGKLARNYEFKEATKAKQEFAVAFKEHIKDSIEDELADAYIRILDAMDGFKLPIRNREATTYESDELMSVMLYKAIEEMCIKGDMNVMLDHLEDIAEYFSINLSWHIEQKMKYNSTRERLHGKQF